MANNEEVLEKIAREEVYPERYDGKTFSGDWPSEYHHKVCLKIAEDTHRLRTAKAKREEQARKKEEAKLNGVEERGRTDSEDSERRGD